MEHEAQPSRGRQPKRRPARPGRFVWTRQRCAAVGLLFEEPVGKAAALLGIHRRTLWRWRQAPEFRERLAALWEAQRRALMEQERRRLAAVSKSGRGR
ncbi:MAG: helix-turn-helix domain-containing protein [Actinomycetota bacterium]